MSRGVDVPWIGDQYTMGRVGPFTMGKGRYSMDKEVKIPWVVGSIYHG